MTTVRIYKAAGSGTHLVIYCTKITEKSTKVPVDYAMPVTQGDWATTNPTRYVLDFKDIKHTFSIEGYIDRSSNKKATSTEWDASNDDDVHETKLKLIGLQTGGGTIKLDYPIASEGYTTAKTYDVMITDIQVEDVPEIVNDQISQPGSTNRAELYAIKIECFEATNQ